MVENIVVEQSVFGLVALLTSHRFENGKERTTIWTNDQTTTTLMLWIKVGNFFLSLKIIDRNVYGNGQPSQKNVSQALPTTYRWVTDEPSHPMQCSEL